jgi:hypothetical protein
MKTEFKLITPAIAEDLLKKNSMNRFIKRALIENYSRQMAVGIWKEDTGEAIKIAYDGTILDGQHRLISLIKSNVSLNFLVITGMDKEVFRVLDTGSKRSSGDIFHIAGIENSRNLAAGIRKYIILGQERTNISNSAANLPISSSELLSLYTARNRFWDAAVTMSLQWYVKSQRLLLVSEILGYYAFFYDINKDSAFQFFDSLCGGVMLTATDPIKLLKDKLSFSRMNPKFTMLQSHKYALMIKSWNLFRDKKQIKKLVFGVDEEFQTAI